MEFLGMPEYHAMKEKRNVTERHITGRHVTDGEPVFKRRVALRRLAPGASGAGREHRGEEREAVPERRHEHRVGGHAGQEAEA